MNLKPMNDKIVVRPDVRVKSQILEVIMDEKDNMGEVVAVGPGKKVGIDKREPMPVSVGDYVRFGTMGTDEYLKYQEYFEDGIRYLVMSWQDVCFITDRESASAT